jgi:DNA-binding NarL/FixJ family response regulator
MTSINTFIVEDSAVIRDNLVAALEEMAPVRVVGSAADESAAVDWLLDPPEHCDLVIVDIFLRSGSGLGVLQRLAAVPNPPKRVVLTNYATPDMRSKCQSLGANRVFDKSNEVDELIAYCTRLGRDGLDTTPGTLTPSG